MEEDLLAPVKNNKVVRLLLFCSGLASLSAVSLGFLRTSFSQIEAFLLENFTISLELTSKDDCFGWIKLWLQKYSPALRHLSGETLVSTDVDDTYFNSRRLVFYPNVGAHTIKFAGKRVWVERKRSANTDLCNGGWMESIVLRLWWPGKATDKAVDFFTSILCEAKLLAEKADSDKTVIHTNSQGTWTKSGTGRVIRPLDSVFLADGVAENIVQDLTDFLDTTAWYRERGIPYRRGYLLYGQPGGGKSSFIRALAGHFRIAICVCNLTDDSLTDDTLNTLFLNAEPHSIILLEDVDAAFDCKSRETKRGGISMAGLLNAIDGVASQEGRILFMTTNHKELLDSALIRPGRVDVVIEFEKATYSQIVKMLCRFYKKDALDEIKLRAQVEQALPEDKTFSMASLQGHLLKNKHSVEDCLETLGIVGSD